MNTTKHINRAEFLKRKKVMELEKASVCPKRQKVLDKIEKFQKLYDANKSANKKQRARKLELKGLIRGLQNSTYMKVSHMTSRKPTPQRTAMESKSELLKAVRAKSFVTPKMAAKLGIH